MDNSAAARSRRAFFLLFGFYAAALALHAATGASGGPALWAFLHWRPFPDGARVAFAAAGAAIAAAALFVQRGAARGSLPASAHASDAGASDAGEESRAMSRARRLASMLVAIALFALTVVALGNTNEFFGDIKLYEDKFEAARSGPILRDPIDRLPDRTIMTIDYALFRAGRGVWPGVRARDVFAAVSVASGAAFVLLAARLGQRWGAAAPLLLLGSPALLLFLGYGEHYGIVSAGILLTLVAGFRASEGEIDPWWVLASALAVSIVHLAGTILVPAALYLVVATRRRERRVPRASRAARFACGILAAVVCALLGEVAARPADSTLGRIALPLVRDASVPYALFSLDHVAFVAGAVLFVGLVPLGAIAWALAVRDRAALDAAFAHTFTRFVLIAVASALAFTFVIDPKLGVRDWDLLSLSSVPLAVAAAWLMSGIERDGDRGSATREARAGDLAAPLVLCAGIAAWHTGPWIAANARTESAAALTQEWVESDTRYTRSYAGASDVTPFLKLASIFERADLPERALASARRSAEVSPNSVESWITIGKLLRNAGRRDEAAVALRRASALAPANSLPAYLEGLCLGESGRYAEALAAFDRALAAAPGNAEIAAARAACAKLANGASTAGDSPARGAGAGGR